MLIVGTLATIVKVG